MTKFSKAMILCAALGASGVTMAQGAWDLKMYNDIEKFGTMDQNKDGMVSKAEFVKMMEKSFDTAAKKMGVKDGKMTEAQYKEFMEAVYARRGG